MKSNLKVLPTSDQSTLDSNVLQALRDLDEPGQDGQFLNELIDLFEDSAPQLIDELENAISTEDAKKTTYYSHRLKGLSGNIGAAALQDMFRQLESTAPEAKSSSDIAQLVRQEFKVACQELDKNWRKS